MADTSDNYNGASEVGENLWKLFHTKQKSKNSIAGKTTHANLVYLCKMIEQATENFLSIPFVP